MTKSAADKVKQNKKSSDFKVNLKKLRELFLDL
jgi:hypothetical protein